MNILSLDRDVRVMGSRSKMTKLDVKISEPLIPKEVITPENTEQKPIFISLDLAYIS